MQKHPSRADRLTLRLPSSPRFLSLVRVFLQETSRSCGMPETVLQVLQTAVTEALDNAIEHAHAFREGHEVALEVTVRPGEVTVALEYDDPGFDPAAIPDPVFGGTAEGGYGVFLMRQLMDEVRYERTGPSTVRVRLVKRWKDAGHAQGTLHHLRGAGGRRKDHADPPPGRPARGAKGRTHRDP